MNLNKFVVFVVLWRKDITLLGASSGIGLFRLGFGTRADCVE